MSNPEAAGADRALCALLQTTMASSAPRAETPQMAPLAISAAALVIDHSSPLGVGASCAVNRATLNAVPVAAKTCTATQSAEEQFSREVRRLHACRHPNIINVYGVAALCERPRRPADLALVTELCAGGSLQAAIERLRRRQMRRRRSRRRRRSQDDSSNTGSNSTVPGSACDDSGHQPALGPGAECRDLDDQDVQDVALPTDTIVRVAGGVASALAYLHDSGLSQGDVKPLNVLLTQPLLPDGSLPVGAEAKMCDFGLSRRFVAPSPDSQVKTPKASAPVDLPPLSPVPKCTTEARPLRAHKPAGDEAMQGTVPYLAPEAFAGIPSNKSGLACAADVYALGICLYELVTLRTAWPHHSNWGVFNAVVQRGERPPWPTEMGATKVAAPWRELVELCWHQDPASRPTARFVLSEIVRVGDDLKNREAEDTLVSSETRSKFSALEETTSQSSESTLGDSHGDVEFLNLALSSDDEAANLSSDLESGQGSSSEKCSSCSTTRSEETTASTVVTSTDADQTASDPSLWMTDSVDVLFDGLDLRRVTSRRLSFVLDSTTSDAENDSSTQNGEPLSPRSRRSSAINCRGAGRLDESEDSGDDSYLTERVPPSSQKVRTSITENAESGSFPVRSAVVAGGAPLVSVQTPDSVHMSKSASPSLQVSLSKCSEDADVQLQASIASIVGKWNVLAARRPVKKKSVLLQDSTSAITAEIPASNLSDFPKVGSCQPSSKAHLCTQDSACVPNSLSSPQHAVASELPVSQKSSLPGDNRESRVSPQDPEKGSPNCVLMSEEDLNRELAPFVSSDSLLSY